MQLNLLTITIFLLATSSALPTSIVVRGGKNKDAAGAAGAAPATPPAQQTAGNAVEAAGDIVSGVGEALGATTAGQIVSSVGDGLKAGGQSAAGKPPASNSGASAAAAGEVKASKASSKSAGKGKGGN
jgi:hypothetical protein